MKIGVYSLKLDQAVELARKIVGLDWEIHVATQRLDIARMAIRRECQAAIFCLSLDRYEVDIAIGTIKTISPDFPIILCGENLCQKHHDRDRDIYYLDTPLNIEKLKDILQQIRYEKFRIECAA